MLQTRHHLGQDVLLRRLGLAAVFVLALLLALSLVPVLALSRYARASTDDYSFAYFTHQAVLSGSSILRAAGHTMKHYYFGWQGSFSSTALMSLVPCIFSEGLYFLTTPVMLASLMAGTLKLTHTLVCRVLKRSWTLALLLALPALLLSIQFLPAPREAFYWWNGAMYYTFIYGISLLYVERLAVLFLHPPGAVPWWAVLPGVLWAVIVGGSNYVSALLCAMLGGCFLLFALYQRRCRGWVSLLLLSELVPFLISILSPGNQIRQAAVSSMSPLAAIGASIAQAWTDLTVQSDFLTWVLCLLWIPILLALAKSSGLTFRLPGVFMVFTFLLFAAQNTPHFYAVSTAGPGRLRNIIYFSRFWLLALNEWYCLGWLARILSPRLERLKCRERPKLPLAALSGCVLLLLVVGLGCFYAPQSLSAECLRELSDSSAAAYAQERDQRLEVLLDPNRKAAVFPPLEAQPPLLAQGDLTTDPDHWVNLAQARYFGKDAVVLAE